MSWSNDAHPDRQDLGLGSWPARRARHVPEKIAWTFQGVDTTFAEVRDRVDRLAGGMAARGLRAGDRVAFFGTNHPALLELLFASARLGAIAVLINPRLAEREVSYILADSGAKLLLRVAGCGDDFGIFAPSGSSDFRQIVIPGASDGGTVGSDEYSDLLSLSDPYEHATSGLDDPCLIMYTSGTTGRPKGAVLTAGNLLFNDVNSLIEYDIRPDEVCIAAAPMYHIAMLNGLVLPVFLKGGRTIIHTGFRPSEVLADIAGQRVTSFFGVPAMMDAMMQEPQFAATDLTSMRTVLVGGAPVPMRVLRTWGARGVQIQQGYGLTETSPAVTKLSADDSVSRAGSAGKPPFFVDARVVAPAGGQQGTGEIETRGPNVFHEYWGQEEATRAAFTADGWFRTGDVASIDADGYFYLLDRMKDMYVSGGENVYPAEVESALLDLPGVAAAAVIGVPDDRWGEVGRAFVVPATGASIDEQGILAGLDGRLARYKKPRSVILVDELPRTATGKLQKHIIRSTHLEQA